VSLTLQIRADLEDRLAAEAARRGMAVGDYTLQILESHLPPQDRRAAAVALLQSWIDQGDQKEQKETGDFLIRSLDEDRPSERKLFPAELEGISW
jgi:hypothetical protein